MNKSRIYTVADVGSNTVKCAVFLRRGSEIAEIASDTEKLGLIAGIENGNLTGERTEALCETLARFCELGKREAAGRGIAESDAVLVCCATAAMRGIGNFEEVDFKVRDRIGVGISLLSPEEEARTAFAGFRSLNPSPENGVLADLGGGSTELSEFAGKVIKRLTSLGFGCLSLYKRFCKTDLPTAEEEENIYRFVYGLVSESGFAGAGADLCFVGGTGNAIRRLFDKFGILTGDVLVPADLASLRGRLAERDPDDMEMICRSIPTRRETIIPGLTAYCAIADALGAASVRLLKGGLREGIMKELAEKDDG